MLAGTSEVDQDTHLPTIANSNSMARIFSDRPERNVEPAGWESYVRDVEASLARRISRVEKAIEDQSGLIGDLHAKSSATEDSVRKLLGAVEGFCEQTTRQLEAMSAPALSAPALSITPEPPVPKIAMEPVMAAAPAAAEAIMVEAAGGSAIAETTPEPVTISQPEAEATLSWIQSLQLPQLLRRNWHVGVAAAILVMAAVLVGTWGWQNFGTGGSGGGVTTPVVTANDKAVRPVAPPQPVPQAQPAAPSQPAGSSLGLEASELTWVSLRASDGKGLLARVFKPGDQETFDLPSGAILRLGNAGGVQVRLNGQPIGPVGSHGQVREVVFRDGSYKIVTTEQQR
jgi:uncharacterized protein DUF4115